MIRFVPVVLLAMSGIAVAAPAAPRRSTDVTPPASARSWELTMSRSTLLGFQRSIQRGQEQGKSTQGVLDCANQVDPARFVPQFRATLERVLTPEEIDVTERFWKSDTGAHVAELTVFQLYQQLGLKSPVHSPPAFSDAEQARIAEISSSSSARKLVEEFARFPDRLDPAVGASIVALHAECRAKGG